MAYRAGLHNFSKGVLSADLHGRVDVAAYNAGLRQGTNVVVLKYGGFAKRMGTRLVYEIKDGEKRLFPFDYSLEQSYVLVFGQGSMRPAALGGMVLDEALTVEAATRTNPVKITASYHGYTTGDEVFFRDVKGMAELNGLTLPVTVIDQHNFTVPVNGTSFGSLTGDDGGVIRSGPPDPDPAPPVVPPPVDPPPPPNVGGGGWRGSGRRFNIP